MMAVCSSHGVCFAFCYTYVRCMRRFIPFASPIRLDCCLTGRGHGKRPWAGDATTSLRKGNSPPKHSPRLAGYWVITAQGIKHGIHTSPCLCPPLRRTSKLRRGFHDFVNAADSANLPPAAFLPDSNSPAAKGTTRQGGRPTTSMTTRAAC